MPSFQSSVPENHHLYISWSLSPENARMIFNDHFRRHNIPLNATSAMKTTKARNGRRCYHFFCSLPNSTQPVKIAEVKRCVGHKKTMCRRMYDFKEGKQLVVIVYV